MRSKYYPSHIANYFLSKSELTNYILNKLVYFSYGFYLASKNKKLFSEKIEAWKYGPVIPSIYHHLVRFGNQPITKMVVYHSRSKDKRIEPKVDSSDEEIIDLLEIVYKKYGNLPESTLQEMTHHPNSPWEKVYIADEDCIPLDDTHIKEHFRSLLPIRTLNAEVTNGIRDISDFTGPFDNAEDFMNALYDRGHSSSGV